MTFGIQMNASGRFGDFMIDKYYFNRKVFVTGATGFLGGHLIEKLVKLGADITVLIRDFTPNSVFYKKEYYKSINIVNGDIEDYDVINRLITEYEIQTVFHIAAQAIVKIANINPAKTFNTNIKGTWNILEACRNSKTVQNIIVASSDKAYGDQSILPYTESMPLCGKHPYDVSKSCADLLSYSYYNTYSLPVCITRCGNLFGPGDLNFNRIIPQTIKSVLFGERPIIRSDGNYTRDYFYIVDAADAYIRLAYCMQDSKIHGEAYNFGNDTPISVLQIVNKILDLMKSDLEPIVLNQASNEIRDQYLSSKKSKTELAWMPKYSIDEGLKDTIEWYRDFFNLKYNNN